MTNFKSHALDGYVALQAPRPHAPADTTPERLEFLLGKQATMISSTKRHATFYPHMMRA